VPSPTLSVRVGAAFGCDQEATPPSVPWLQVGSAIVLVP